MNLIKIGKFISELRKEKKMTQEELAEKLMITDRAVSKWERGLSLPDADKMLDLCKILGININELLIGERINMKDSNKKSEELLVEMAKKEELKNKQLMAIRWVIFGVSFIFYLEIVLLAAFTLKEGTLCSVIIILSTIIFLIASFWAFKIEIDTGYYECKNCHKTFIPTYYDAMIHPVMGTTRYLKCPKCHKKTWAKKILSK